jgi:hypothetical protein
MNIRGWDPDGFRDAPGGAFLSIPSLGSAEYSALTLGVTRPLPAREGLDKMGVFEFSITPWGSLQDLFPHPFSGPSIQWFTAIAIVLPLTLFSLPHLQAVLV